MITPRAQADTAHQVELVIGGMTCAACAARVERKLNKLDDVTATVNYATEKAQVLFGPGVTVDGLIATIERTGYTAALVQPRRRSTPAEDGAPTDATRPLRTRLLVSAALAGPVIAMAMVPALQFRNWQWASLTLAAPVVVWGALPFHRAAWTNLRHGTASMDTLVSLGGTAAFGWSLYSLFLGTAGTPGMTHAFHLSVQRSSGAGDIYLEVAAGLTTFILAGRFFEARSKRRAGAALRALAELASVDVVVLRGGREWLVPIEDLAVGDSFLVRPGQQIATDGVVEQGSSAVDTALMTGESVPVEVSAGDPVVGGTMNVGGQLVVRVTRVGADTQLAQISALVERAQNGKASAQRLADRVAAVFVPIVLILAVATLGFWLAAGGSVALAAGSAVAVLIVACPCALGLATPTALLVGTGRGAQLGILIKGPEVLESTRRVDTVMLDKTGTVTTGTMTVLDVVAAANEDADQVLRHAAELERSSEHPIGRAIVATAGLDGGTAAAVSEFHSVAGLGVRGTVSGHAVVVGRPALLAEAGMPLPGELDRAVAAAQACGHTVVAVGWDGLARGLLTVADEVRPTSALAVRSLRALGLTPVLLTGDNHAAARSVAVQVGIDEVIAEVPPAGKAEVVRRLQEQGRVVAMVGDGVNDAAALAQADLGVAIGTGTDIAIQASDLTLVRADIRVACDAIELSRRTLGIIKGNLCWAFAYNLAALPLAAAGLLNPMIAGAAMACSSVLVVSNSLRLRHFVPTNADDLMPRIAEHRGM